MLAGDDVLADEDLVDEEGEEEAAQLGVVQVLLDQLLGLDELDLPLDPEVALHSGGRLALASATLALLTLCVSRMNAFPWRVTNVQVLLPRTSRIRLIFRHPTWDL